MKKLLDMDKRDEQKQKEVIQVFNILRGGNDKKLARVVKVAPVKEQDRE